MKKFIGVLIVIALIISFAGCSSVSQEDYQKALDNNSALQAEFDSYKADTSDWLEYSEIEKQSLVTIAKRETEIKELDDKKSNLELTIKSLQAQAEKLQGSIIQLIGEPKTYPAGYLYAGTDFTAGRYKIYDGSSNFIVHSASGNLRVNEILGKDDVTEYIYTFANGDEIKAGSSFKMVKIK